MKHSKSVVDELSGLKGSRDIANKRYFNGSVCSLVTFNIGLKDREFSSDTTNLYIDILHHRTRNVVKLLKIDINSKLIRPNLNH